MHDTNRNLWSLYTVSHLGGVRYAAVEMEFT